MTRTRIGSWICLAGATVLLVLAGGRALAGEGGKPRTQADRLWAAAMKATDRNQWDVARAVLTQFLRKHAGDPRAGEARARLEGNAFLKSEPFCINGPKENRIDTYVSADALSSAGKDQEALRRIAVNLVEHTLRLPPYDAYWSYFKARLAEERPKHANLSVMEWRALTASWNRTMFQGARDARPAPRDPRKGAPRKVRWRVTDALNMYVDWTVPRPREQHGERPRELHRACRRPGAREAHGGGEGRGRDPMGAVGSGKTPGADGYLDADRAREGGREVEMGLEGGSDMLLLHKAGRRKHGVP